MRLGSFVSILDEHTVIFNEDRQTVVLSLEQRTNEHGNITLTREP